MATEAFSRNIGKVNRLQLGSKTLDFREIRNCAKNYQSDIRDTSSLIPRLHSFSLHPVFVDACLCTSPFLTNVAIFPYIMLLYYGCGQTVRHYTVLV